MALSHGSQLPMHYIGGCISEVPIVHILLSTTWRLEALAYTTYASWMSRPILCNVCEYYPEIAFFLLEHHEVDSAQSQG